MNNEQAKKCYNKHPDYAACDQFVCSNCGIELIDWRRVDHDEDGDITYHEYEFNYCPNCGAKLGLIELSPEDAEDEKTVTVKIKRIELCDLLLACTALDDITDENTKKWAKLHDKLKEILDDYDSKHEI